MRAMLTRCPICGTDLAVSRLECAECGTILEGRFAPAAGPFAGLSPEQLAFVWTFVRCEGKFTRMEKETGLSYPTLRSRLYEILRLLGVEPGLDESAPELADERRRQVLADLEQGRITANEAIAALEGGK